ncbi:hypothetical protein MMC13_007436 [Lambiella insularis]|nr:hypothetical protein [Lambiella insularis]
MPPYYTIPGTDDIPAYAVLSAPLASCNACSSVTTKAEETHTTWVIRLSGTLSTGTAKRPYLASPLWSSEPPRVVICPYTPDTYALMFPAASGLVVALDGRDVLIVTTKPQIGEMVERIKEGTTLAAQEILHEATAEAMMEMRRVVERAKEEAMKEAMPVAEMCTVSLSVLEERFGGQRTNHRISVLSWRTRRKG